MTTLPWINFALLLAASALAIGSYYRSVRPMALQKKLGPRAFEACTRWRIVSIACVLVTFGCYVVYRFFPLPLPLPEDFPWPWWISTIVAVLLAVPAVYLVCRGIHDAGRETVAPHADHALCGGIYTKIRHPQAIGGLPLWIALAMLMHSPFLLLYSLLFVPAWLFLCRAEERDLLLRYGQIYEQYRQRTGFMLPKRCGRS